MKREDLGLLFRVVKDADHPHLDFGSPFKKIEVLKVFSYGGLVETRKLWQVYFELGHTRDDLSLIFDSTNDLKTYLQRLTEELNISEIWALSVDDYNSAILEMRTGMSVIDVFRDQGKPVMSRSDSSRKNVFQSLLEPFKRVR